MTIYAIKQVRDTFAAAMSKAPDRETAIHVTAQHLGLPVDVVREVVEQEAAAC